MTCDKQWRVTNFASINEFNVTLSESFIAQIDCMPAGSTKKHQNTAAKQTHRPGQASDRRVAIRDSQRPESLTSRVRMRPATSRPRRTVARTKHVEQLARLEQKAILFRLAKHFAAAHERREDDKAARLELAATRSRQAQK